VAELADRVQRVRLLLETLNDPYPTPRSALRSDSGPAASRYVPCETCRRSGWIRRRRGVATLCLACDGAGWRRRTRQEPEWDAYLGLPVVEAVQLPVEAPPKPRPASEDEDTRYGWEKLKDAYEKRGSYKELRLRLVDLSHSAPRRHHLIRLHLVDQEGFILLPADEREIDLGVTTLALRMRSVRVPPWLLEHEQRSTNALIRALAADGLKPGQVAARLGINPEVVKRTLRKQRQRGTRPLETV
jgi:hypothetical protein